MPTNERLTPRGGFCPVTDAFCESPGRNVTGQFANANSGHEFWESPGLERRSGALLPTMIGARLVVGKLIHGRPHFRFADTSNASWFDLNIRRWEREEMVGWKDDEATIINQISTVNQANGVPSTSGQNQLPNMYFFGGVTGLYWMAGDGLDYSNYGYFDAIDFDSYSWYGQAIAGDGQPRNAEVDAVASEEADYAALYEQAQTACDNYNVLGIWNGDEVNGITQTTGFNEFNFARVGTYYGATDFSSYTGAFVTPSGASRFVGNNLPICAWNYGTSPAKISAERAAVKFPASDPLPQRNVRIVARKIYYDGTVEETLLGVETWQRNTFYQRDVPPFQYGLRSFAVYARG